MNSLKLDVKTIDQLDLALVELEALSGQPATYVSGGRVAFLGDMTLTCPLGPDVKRVLRRSAFALDFGTLDTYEMGMWGEMRGNTVEPLQDHSTHNVFPFEGKMMPQLARALVNICAPKATHIVYDPFCGSGTVLLEAALMGLRAIGTDIEPLSVYISAIKVNRDIGTLEKMYGALKHQSGFVGYNLPPIATILESWKRFYPSGDVMVARSDCILFAQQQRNKYDAIVTSPPYFNAIDYNTRHLALRRRLSYEDPPESGLGIRQSADEYQRTIESMAGVFDYALRPGGRIALVVGDHENVPSTAWWEMSLKSQGLRLFYKANRPYKSPTRGFFTEAILIMEKPDAED